MQNLTLNWLKRHIDFFEKDILKLLEKIDFILNQKGAEVEDIRLVNPLITVKIIDIARKEGVKVAICKTEIPEETRRFLKSYDSYSNPIQVLCGASNVKSGMFVILAPLETQICGFTIAPRSIKGLESFGMFCSEDELGLEKTNDGLFQSQEEIGSIYRVDDVIFKISTPTNRWDFMNVRGVARELANAGLGKFLPLAKLANLPSDIKLKFPEISAPEILVKNYSSIKIDFITVENITVSKEILDLMNTLNLNEKHKSKENFYSLKCLNDFVLMDIGHSIHIYDNHNDNHYNKPEITIKTVEEGQNFTTLKGNNFITKGKEVIIYIENEPACIGGIMGISGFGEKTKNVIIEAGYFYPENITSLISEASKSFNLGIDFNQKTLSYVQSLVSGTISSILETGLENLPILQEILIDIEELNRVSGLDFTLISAGDFLKSYGFDIMDNKIIVPSWRSDIKNFRDVIEEILRIRGLEDFQENSYISRNNYILENFPRELEYQNFEENIRGILSSKGLIEMYNFPFSSSNKMNFKQIEITNSINTERRFLRNSLLESLQENLEETLKFGSSFLKAFEIGKIYYLNGSEVVEDIKLGIIFGGKTQRSWREKSRSYNFHDLKEIVFSLKNVQYFQRISENYSQTFDGNVLELLNSEQEVVGILGKLKNGVYFAEISMEKLEKMERNRNQFQRKNFQRKNFQRKNFQRKIFKDLNVPIKNGISQGISLEILKNKIQNRDYYIFDCFERDGCTFYGLTFIFDQSLTMDAIENEFNDIKTILNISDS